MIYELNYISTRSNPGPSRSPSFMVAARIRKRRQWRIIENRAYLGTTIDIVVGNFIRMFIFKPGCTKYWRINTEWLEDAFFDIALIGLFSDLFYQQTKQSITKIRVFKLITYGMQQWARSHVSNYIIKQRRVFYIKHLTNLARDRGLHG